MKNILSWYKSNFKTFSGFLVLAGFVLGGLYSSYYKDGFDFAYTIVGFLIAEAIVAIIEIIFRDKWKNF